MMDGLSARMMMQMLNAQVDMPCNIPTQRDIGKFVSENLLLDWHRKMQIKMPKVCTPEDKMFGKHGRQHPYGTKLMTFFDDDPNKPMRCEVKGSKWNTEMYMGLPDNREPYYVILINGELSQIPFTDAHEEGGWEVGWDRKVPGEQKEEEDEFPRKCIMCSNPQCAKTNPKLRCLCEIAYYCSHECRADDLDDHAFYCRTAEDMRKLTMRTYGSQLLDPSEIPPLVHAEWNCTICNKDTKERHPHGFQNCDHVYCHDCLESWYDIKGQGCPSCRAERSTISPISKFEKDIFFLANFCAAKANKRPKGSIGRRMLCDQALDYINRLIGRKLNNFTKSEIFLSKVKILNLHGREMHKSISLDLARQEFSKGTFTEKILLAETEGLNGNWQEALDIYNDIYVNNLANTAPKQRETIMGISRCLYELGKYVFAIMYGFAARDMNPHFPGVHKYIALSQEAQGDLVAATDTMNRAVLYEAPWDDNNTFEIRNMFQELKAKKNSKPKKSIIEDSNKDKYVLCKTKLDSLALSHGYEAIDTSSSTAPMASYRRGATRLNFWLTTGTVGSYLYHPKRGKTQLFRRDVIMTEVESIFENPRVHTGKGYQRRYQKSKGRCRYGNNCYRSNCYFDH